MENNFHPDAIIIGSGLAGLVAAMEITNAGKKVLLLDQETEQNIGGQAFWSFGGLFLINSPQQRKWELRIPLSLQDRTGWEQLTSIVKKTTGQDNGLKLI
ncbi:FAD-binding protein [Elizabethkingia anophelis]